MIFCTIAKEKNDLINLVNGQNTKLTILNISEKEKNLTIIWYLPQTMRSKESHQWVLR
jgi:ABC-type metal ion transport system substrate-binding protein